MAVMSGTAAVMQTPMGFLVDRHGGRPFLIGGTLLMTLSMAAMGFASAYWQLVLLALLSGVGNSVFHPADYAILSGSIDPARLGRSFAFHTFTGNIGFAAAPPATAALMLLLGWRGALIFVGLLGLPVAATIIWQSRILIDQARRPQRRAAEHQRGAGLLLSPSVLMFFVLYGLVDGRSRDSILADHDPPPGAWRDPWSRLLGADRIYGRPDRRRIAWRLGRRPHRPPLAVCRGSDDRRRRHIAAGRWRRAASGGDDRRLVYRRPDDRGEPHAARCNGQGRRAARADRQGVRLCQLRDVARRCHHTA